MAPREQDQGRRTASLLQDSIARKASVLRAEAHVLQTGLDRMEKFDWPCWLREADALTRRISELKRQAADLEAIARRRAG